jgi:CRISP-associated protein Cas1
MLQLVIDTNGAVLRRKNASFWIHTKNQSRIISPHRIDSIALSANCMISTAALRLAILHQIPVYLHDGYGRPEGAVMPASLPSLAMLRRQQALFYYLPQATEYIIEVFEAKLTMQLAVLEAITSEKPIFEERKKQLLAAAEQWQNYSNERIDNVRAQIMGIEGNIARMYWKWLSEALPNGYRFERRSRQPAEDLFNCLLNYGYGMLYTVVEAAIVSVGLDPQMGFLHTDEYNQPSLAFDLIEPFRAFVDKLVIDLCRNGSIKMTWFIFEKDNAVLLATAGKKEFIPLFYQMLHYPTIFLGENNSPKQHCYKYVAKLGSIIRNIDFQIN